MNQSSNPRSFMLVGDAYEAAKKMTELTMKRQREVQRCKERVGEQIQNFLDETQGEMDALWDTITESVGLDEDASQEYRLDVEFLCHGVAFLKSCGSGVDAPPESDEEMADILGDILNETNKAGRKH